ncbi:hypothetical protein FOL46_002680, partial [Perkinsus olseni]
MTGSHKGSTIDNYVRILKATNLRRGSELDAPSVFAIKVAVKAAKKRTGGPEAAQKRALTKDEVVGIGEVQTVPGVVNNLQEFRAATLIAIFGLLRCREALSLKRGDVVFSSAQAAITLRKSKTDQFMAGHTVVIGCSAKSRPGPCVDGFCPFLRLKAWFESCSGQADDLLFPGLTYETWRLDLRCVIAYLSGTPTSLDGVGTTSVALHSLRRTGEQLLWRAGFSLLHLREYGRWRSNAYLEYLKGVTLSEAPSYAAAMMAQPPEALPEPALKAHKEHMVSSTVSDPSASLMEGAPAKDKCGASSTLLKRPRTSRTTPASEDRGDRMGRLVVHGPKGP